MGAVGRVGTGLHGSRARLRVLHSGAWLAVGTRFRPPLLYSLRSGQRHEAAGPRDWADWDLVEVEGTPQLLVADGAGTIRRLTLDGAEVGEPTVVADVACLAVDTPVDPHVLAVGTASGDLHLWRWRPAFDHLGSTPASFADLQAVSVVADGRSAHLAATGSYDSMVHYWTFAAGAWAGGPIAFASNPSAGAQVCVDGDRALVVCSNEGALEWWDGTERRPLARSRTQRQRRNLTLTSLGGTGFGQLQPDPGSVLVLSDDGRVALLDGRNSPRSFQLDCGPLARAVIAVSRDGDGADSLIVAAVEEDDGDNEWALWQIPAKEFYYFHERYGGVLFDLPEDPSTAVDRHYAEALRNRSNGLLVPVVGFDDLRPAPAPTLIGSQPKRLDAAAYLFARYFKEEMRFDHVQYAPPESAEKNRKFETWLLNGRAEGRPLVAGAACFWPPGNGAPAVLRWVWVHPAFRRKGLLRTAWPTFTERYGRFRLEPPVSSAMKAFLASLGEQSWNPEAPE